MWEKLVPPFAILCLLTFPPDLYSDPIVLSASFTRIEAGLAFGRFESSLSQSFFVRNTGDLARFDAFVGDLTPDTRTITLAIHRTAGGLPIGEALARRTVSAAAVPPPNGGFTAFSDLRIPVRAGDSFAAILSTFGRAQWLGARDGYADGVASVLIGDSNAPTWTVFRDFDGTTFDFAFRAFVDVGAAPIPEPATVILLAMGGLILGHRNFSANRFARHRRQHCGQVGLKTRHE